MKTRSLIKPTRYFHLILEKYTETHIGKKEASLKSDTRKEFINISQSDVYMKDLCCTKMKPKTLMCERP
jgi:hypothetical protein